MIGDTKMRFVMATMQIRNNHITAPERLNEEKLRQAGLSRGGYFSAVLSQLDQRDTTILAQLGFRDFNEYWRVGLSPETKEVFDFVRLLESHLLDPGQLADPGRRRIDTLLEAALEQAIESDELWFVPEVEVDKEEVCPARLHPREAAGWLLKMYPDLVPLTLRAFLESDTARSGVSAQYERKKGGRSRERRNETMKILLEQYPRDGRPPKGSLAPILTTVNSILKDRGYAPISDDTLKRAINDLAQKHLPHLTQN